ncbi:MAG: hypothetical protein ACRCSB_04365 [Bacteroidales bacterium]
MKKLFFILLVVIAFGTACNQDDTKLNWTPEFAVPVTTFILDLNEHIDFADFCLHYLYMVDSRSQNLLLFEALGLSLQDSVKKRLPQSVQNQIDTFIYRIKADLPILDYTAPILLSMLSESLVEQGSIASLNLLTYHILIGLPNELQSLINDSLQNKSVLFKDALEFNLGEFAEDIEDIKQTKVLINIAAPLRVHAVLSMHLLDSTESVFETLLSDNERFMPYPNEKMQVIRLYDEAQTQQIALVNQIKVNIQSDSLGIDIEQLKDLSQRKIEMRVGIGLKINLDKTMLD